LPFGGIIFGLVGPGWKGQRGAHAAELVAVQRAEPGQDLRPSPVSTMRTARASPDRVRAVRALGAVLG
jgi:hypothetical protein